MDLRELNRPARAAVMAILGVGFSVFIAFLTARGSLIPALTALAGATALALAFRYPRAALLVYAATIPLETVQIEGLATLSRLMGAAFFVGYVLARRGIRPDAIRGSAWFLVGLACLSLLWSVQPDATSSSLLTLVQLFGITIMVADAVSREPAIVRPVLWSYSAAASATSVLAIVAYATNRTALISDRAGAFSDQDVAQFSALIIPAFLFLTTQLARGDRRVLAAAGATLCGVGILLSGTRSAWLAIVVALVVAILPRMRPSQIVWMAVVAGSVSIAALQLPGVADVVTGRLGNAAATGGSGRLDIWAVGLSIIAAHPLVGVGYGAFPAAFTADVIRSASVPGLDAAVLSTGRGSHSILLSTGGELGVIGLLLLAWLVMDVLLRPGVHPWGSVVQGIVLAVLIQALFLDVLGRKQVWLVFGLAFGLDYARRRIASATDHAEEDQVPPPVGRPPDGQPVRAGPLRGRQAIG